MKKNNLQKCSSWMFLWSAMLSVLLFLQSGQTAYAQEQGTSGLPYATTVAALKADAPQQKLIVKAGDFSAETTMEAIGGIAVVAQEQPDGSRLCYIPDFSGLDFLMAGIDASLMNNASQDAFYYYDTATATFQTYPGTSYKRIGEAEKQQIYYKLLELLSGNSKKDGVVTLAEDALETVYLQIPDEILANKYAVKGSCTTSFKGSSANRIQNIQTASANINNMVLLPGQEVSISDAFQPRTYANGYREAGAYLNGKVVPAIGGGICQVSSTIYNAAMNSGLTVLCRYPHSMPVHYLPLGMDAAISSGSKDLRIRNDYPFPVLFEGYTEGKNVTVNVYTNELLTAGCTYRLHAVRKGSLAADTYLEISVNGIVTEDRLIGTSKYSPMLPEAEETED